MINNRERNALIGAIAGGVIVGASFALAQSKAGKRLRKQIGNQMEDLMERSHINDVIDVGTVGFKIWQNLKKKG